MFRFQLGLERGPSNYIFMFRFQLGLERRHSNYKFMLRFHLGLENGASNYIFMFRFQLGLERGPSNYIFSYSLPGNYDELNFCKYSELDFQVNLQTKMIIPGSQRKTYRN